MFIDETGKPIGEEYTLALAVEFWLGVCNKRGIYSFWLSISLSNFLCTFSVSFSHFSSSSSTHSFVEILVRSFSVGVICKNLSSSRANDDIAKKYGCTCEKTAVGEINVRLEILLEISPYGSLLFDLSRLLLNQTR